MLVTQKEEKIIVVFNRREGEKCHLWTHFKGRNRKRPKKRKRKEGFFSRKRKRFFLDSKDTERLESECRELCVILCSTATETMNTKELPEEINVLRG